MRKMGIDSVTFERKRMPYRSSRKSEHYRLIVAAMRAKMEQIRKCAGFSGPPGTWFYGQTTSRRRTQERVAPLERVRVGAGPVMLYSFIIWSRNRYLCTS
jgi:hypothetical protein